jgi:hypothetical protein
MAGYAIRGRVVVPDFNVEVSFNVHFDHAVTYILDADNRAVMVLQNLLMTVTK